MADRCGSGGSLLCGIRWIFVLWAGFVLGVLLHFLCVYRLDFAAVVGMGLVSAGLAAVFGFVCCVMWVCACHRCSAGDGDGVVCGVLWSDSSLLTCTITQ